MEPSKHLELAECGTLDTCRDLAAWPTALAKVTESSLMSLLVSRHRLSSNHLMSKFGQRRLTSS